MVENGKYFCFCKVYSFTLRNKPADAQVRCRTLRFRAQRVHALLQMIVLKLIAILIFQQNPDIARFDKISFDFFPGRGADSRKNFGVDWPPQSRCH